MEEKTVKHEPSSPTIDFKVYELETRSRVDIEPCPFKDVDCVKALWRKLDLRLLPTLAMFLLLSFIDRTNLGNARVAGLQKHLKMTDRQYSIALTVTYIPYIATELPSNLLLKIVGPNVLLPTLLSLWGVVTTLQGLVTSYEGLLCTRFFLGPLEEYLLSTLPPLFHPLSLGGPPGWAWIFILEGLFAFIFGVASFFLLPHSLARAHFLTMEEMAYIDQKLKEDGSSGNREVVDSFSWREVRRGFALPHVWMVSAVFFLIVVV